MNGSDLKNKVAQKAKQAVANVQGATSNGSANGKKRRKQELKPIITTEGQKADDSSFS